jgi:uncharacterized protein (TIGR00730 family)
MSNHRQELDPVPGPEALTPPPSVAAPPRAERRVDSPEVLAIVDKLIEEAGGEPGTFDARLVRDLITTGLKLIPDGRHTGELKLITTAVKELRYAFKVFGQYPEPHKVSIFGSARTPANHPDYIAAARFSKLMAEAGWMNITGAGGGIMEAGHVGPGAGPSFGVAIRLPFEQSTNEVIAKDQKLIHFRYFFTRKLMFISQAEAVALFPGGFGTMDEAFETLTLIQTGKASMIPVICMEGEGGTFWQEFDEFMRKGLADRKWINPEDRGLYHLCKTPEEGVKHIVDFYRNYHSSRYVKDDLIIRMRRRLSEAAMAKLNAEFGKLLKSGAMVQRGPFEEEDDHLHLPRLVFTHTRRDFAMVRRLIDRINELDAAG